MASFKMYGLEDLEKMVNVKAVPPTVMNRMLRAMADVAIPFLRRAVAAKWTGDYSTGTSASVIKRGGIKKTDSGRSISILFGGERSRGKKKVSTTPNSTIAYVNEFGKTGQDARPVIKATLEECADQAVNAAGKVFDDWLETL